MSLNGLATVHHIHGDLAHIFDEAVVFFLNLEGKLARVAHDEDRHWLGVVFELVERGEHEDCSLAHARLSLAEDVDAHH